MRAVTDKKPVLAVDSGSFQFFDFLFECGEVYDNAIADYANFVGMEDS